MARTPSTHSNLWNSFEMALFGVSVFLGSRPRRETGLQILQRDHDRIMFENRHWLL